MTTDYGFCYHWAFSETAERVDQIMSGISNLRAPRVRTAAPWIYVQTSQSVFSWSGTDYAVNKALEKGLAPLLLINGRPNWGPTATDYGNFATLCAQRYGPSGVGLNASNISAGRYVRDFELWNEENQFAFWMSIPVSPEDYTAYLQSACTGIKSVLPGDQSTVLVGGFNPTGDGWFGLMAMQPRNFLSRMYQAGAQGYFDAVATHPYTITELDPPSKAPTLTSPYILEADALYDLMVANGDGAKKIWSTEAGWPCPTTVTQAVQAQYWSDFKTLWEAKPYAGPWFVFEYRDDGTDTSNAEMNFGVVDTNLVPKQAFSFFQTLNASSSIALGGLGVFSAELALKTPGGLSGSGTLSGTVGQSGYARAAALSSSGTLTATVGLSAVPVTLSGSGALTISSRKLSISYTFSGTTKPSGIIDAGENAASSVLSGTIREGTCPAVYGPHFSVALWPNPLATLLYSASVTVGNLNGTATDRAVGPAVGFNSSGSTGVFGWINNVDIKIFTKINTTYTQRASSFGSVIFGDIIKMTITVSGGIYTYTMYKNGASVLSWTDSGGLITPGSYWGGAFNRMYSNGQYASPGITKYVGADT